MYSKRTVIIVPALNDEGGLTTLVRELASELADRTAFSLLVVDDGSIPPIDVGNALLVDGRVLTLSRNLGHQKAIAIGPPSQTNWLMSSSSWTRTVRTVQAMCRTC